MNRHIEAAEYIHRRGSKGVYLSGVSVSVFNGLIRSMTYGTPYGTLGSLPKETLMNLILLVGEYENE